MLKRILVPLDGSGLAERALTYATALARATSAEILLVRVANSHTLPGVDPRERQQGAIGEAEEYLDRELARLIAQGFTSEAVVRFGNAAECISESARTRQVDMIVMTTHGRTGPGRWILGSVTEAVVAASPVPVLVQRAWQPLFGDPLLDEHPSIVVPLDGSAFAESVIDPAAALATDLRGQLVLLTVQDDPGAIRSGDEYLAGVRSQTSTKYPELTVSCEVRNGDPARAIEQVVAQLEVGLVFMATHGRTGPQRTVLGSVAGQLLQECDVPVVLLRPLRTEEADRGDVSSRYRAIDIR